MHMLQALQIVQDLAYQNVLTEDHTAGCITLEEERLEQEQAVCLVGGLIALLEKDHPREESEDAGEDDEDPEGD